MLLLQPKLVILDELDSGLDVDALKLLANTVSKYKEPRCCSLSYYTLPKTVR